MSLQIRPLDLESDDEVALGRALIDEYVTFTADEMERVTGYALEPAVIARLIPDRVDFAGRYRDGAYLLATVAGSPAGGVGTTRVDDARCEMNRLWLREKYRGNGLGRSLVQACIEHARALGFENMVLDVAPYRTGAITLYRSFGFADAPPVHQYPFEMVPLALEL
ncbi:MAG: carbonate dehydratase [Actinomycetia bacterium]|nr:carbonate dehydratase [Actinomycetes bacterium]